ncbi:ATP-binding protein [Streptomyces sp. NPDC004296]|uniref:ATP-binding protein n=1 Tax=Streptomyces sp. NPDC004296 TaxID=3364697 RepID=UPI0036894C79
MTARPLPGNTVELTVNDQGPGMTPDTASRIFERFYRADEARTPTSGGTGLGLGIVKAITQAHGGTITVHTTPGHGSTFTITLPAAH